MNKAIKYFGFEDLFEMERGQEAHLPQEYYLKSFEFPFG